MFWDTLGKIMFSTGRNYLKFVRGARLLHLNSRKSVPQKPELKTVPSKKIELCVHILNIFHIFNWDKFTLNLNCTFIVFQYPISQEDTRRVYVWGLADHGAIGEATSLHKDKISYLLKPKRLSFGERYRVTDIACGYGFTVYAVQSSDKNIVYGTGINTDSQLGN